MQWSVLPIVTMLTTTWGLLSSTLHAKPSVSTIAGRVDAAIAQEVFDESTSLAPRCDDDVFLRRVWLDLAGDIPTPEEVIAFVLDASPDKRERVVRELLASPYYGQNWARYWRDVVFSRSLEDRAVIAAAAMEADLAELLNDGAGWDHIAAQFITAQGDVQENGSAAIIMAQDGRTEEITAEISRIFLGIQIQCAQCHDHPYGRWKREQFHELAAFFPRVGIRGVRQLTKRSFEVFATDRFGKEPRKNNDRRPEAEHFMPDLKDPSAKGAMIQPKFFLTGASLPVGTRDIDRREQLAEWLTNNDWFAIALVNRMWSELVGEGFYEPVDDLGPDRKPHAPKAVEVLADKFRQSGHDLKWLLATICQTEAYQRESRPRRGPEGTPFTANVPQHLRSDQLLNATYTALAVAEDDNRPGNQRRYSPRTEFAETFGYDPSVARESVSNSIPQVLALMNSPQLNSILEARQASLLGQMLPEVEDDEQLVVELYLRCLSRQPEEEEILAALAYCEEVGNRRQSFEDLLWALINSAEFQYRK